MSETLKLETTSTDETYIPPDGKDLLKAQDALRLVELSFGGRKLAKQMLAENIKDGELVAYAKYYWTARNPKK